MKATQVSLDDKAFFSHRFVASEELTLSFLGFLDYLTFPFVHPTSIFPLPQLHLQELQPQPVLPAPEQLTILTAQLLAFTALQFGKALQLPVLLQVHKAEMERLRDPGSEVA